MFGPRTEGDHKISEDQGGRRARFNEDDELYDEHIGWGPLISAASYTTLFLILGEGFTLVWGWGPGPFLVAIGVGILWQLCLLYQKL